jgi:hypothetical protein
VGADWGRAVNLQHGTVVADPDTWRTLAPAPDDATDALCLIAELWADRTTIGFVQAQLQVTPRYVPSEDQTERLGLYGRYIVALLPWAAPMRRAGKPAGSEGTFVAFERVYPTALFGGLH